MTDEIFRKLVEASGVKQAQLDLVQKILAIDDARITNMRLQMEAGYAPNIATITAGLEVIEQFPNWNGVEKFLKQHGLPWPSNRFTRPASSKSDGRTYCVSYKGMRERDVPDWAVNVEIYVPREA